jgi:hypothetical protein
MNGLKYDVVLTFHTNPDTCGVCKFNYQLAAVLGVQCEPLKRGRFYRHPLTSIKTLEIGMDWIERLPKRGTVLLHDRPPSVPTDRHILYADDLGCPPTIAGNPTRGLYRVLTFGMAHKRILHHYVALKMQLDAEHPDYTIEMSTAIHEGTPWQDGHRHSIEDMRAIFGDRLRVLGFLGDDAIAKELHDCDAVALYFEPAFRANNTTAWAAIAAGKTLFTNRDEHSPDVTEIPTWDGFVRRLSAPAGVVTTTQ